MYIAASNARVLQVGSLLANGTRSTCYSLHFYTNTCVLIPAMTFYDVKLQSVKTPVAAKPSGISPNHTCQCSFVNTKPQYNHFSTADYL